MDNNINETEMNVDASNVAQPDFSAMTSIDVEPAFNKQENSEASSAIETKIDEAETITQTEPEDDSVNAETPAEPDLNAETLASETQEISENVNEPENENAQMSEPEDEIVFSETPKQKSIFMIYLDSLKEKLCFLNALVYTGLISLVSLFGFIFFQKIKEGSVNDISLYNSCKILIVFFVIVFVIFLALFIFSIVLNILRIKNDKNKKIR